MENTDIQINQTHFEKVFSIDWFKDNFRINHDNNEKYIKEVKFGPNICIGYIDFKELYQDYKTSAYANFEDIYGVELRDIFKFNLTLILKNIQNHFPHISSQILYDSPCANELIINKNLNLLTRDLYVRYTYNSQHYDCGFDLVKTISRYDVETESNVEIYDNNFDFKYPSSLVNLDYYDYFDVDAFDLNNYYSNCIYNIMIIMCAIQNDEFKLAEIIFTNDNIHNPNFERDLELFEKIIVAHKTKSVDFFEFYESFSPVDPETGKKMTFNKFIKYIETKIMNGNKINLNDKNISVDDFSKIIMLLDSEVSEQISDYRSIYVRSLNMVNSALSLIINLMKKINKTKKNVPEYIEKCILN